MRLDPKLTPTMANVFDRNPTRCASSSYDCRSLLHDEVPIRHLANSAQSLSVIDNSALGSVNSVLGEAYCPVKRPKLVENKLSSPFLREAFSFWDKFLACVF